MSVNIFKVHVSFNKIVLGIFYHRSDGSFKKLRNTLFQRYSVLYGASFKVTWIDNDGDIISIINDDDLSEFEKLKGAQVFVNAEKDQEKDLIVAKIPDPEKPRSLSSLLADLRDRSAKLLVKNLKFDEDTSEEERQFYVQTYPNVNMVANSRLHCTTCSIHIGSAVASEKTIRMHPALRVTHCEKCHTFYNNRDFSQLEYGSELYCRWCGLGNPVFCCSKCPYAFCRKCIVRNLSREKVDGIENNDNWSCFSCSPNAIWGLRAQHWALVNYIQKTKKKILSDEKDQNKVYELMNKDSTVCCPVTKSVQLKRMQDKSTVLPKIVTSPVQQQVEVQKEAEQSDVVDSPLESEPSVVTHVPVTPNPVTMKANTRGPVAAIKPTCQKPLQISELPLSSQTVVIPIDSVNQTTNSSKLSIIPIAVKSDNAFPNPHSTQFNAPTPLKVFQLPSSSQTVPIPNDEVSLAQSKPCPLNIVDVNVACQQAKYTLQNRKLIGFMKETYVKQATPTNSASRIALKLLSESNNIFPNAHSTQLLSVIQSGGMSQNQIILPPIPGESQPHQTLDDHCHSEQYQLQKSTMRYRMNKTRLDASLKRKPIAENPNTSSEMAESRYEHYLQRVRDVCKQIEDEVSFQMKAHKNVRNCNEVQKLPMELHNELSILHTLSINYFKKLQDTLANDMKKTHEADDAVVNQKNKRVPVDNDVEMVEPIAECIVIDSDDENYKSSLQLKSQDSQQITAVSADKATFERDANFKLSTKTTIAEIDEKLKTRAIVVLKKEKCIEERLKAFMPNQSTESVTPNSDEKETYSAAIVSRKEPAKESERQSNIDTDFKLSTQSVPETTTIEIDGKLKSRPIVVLNKVKWIEKRLKAFMQNKSSTGFVRPNSDELIEVPDKSVNNSTKEANYTATEEFIESGKDPINESEADANFKLPTLSESKTISEIDKKLKTPSIEQILKILMQNNITESVTPNNDELIEMPDNNSRNEAIEDEPVESGKEIVSESEESINTTANESIESEAKSLNESSEKTETADESVIKSTNKSVDLFKSFEMFHCIESGKESLDAIASESGTRSNKDSTNATENESIKPEEGSETSFEMNDTKIHLDDSSIEADPELKSETALQIAENDTTTHPTYLYDSESESVYESGKEFLDESFEIMDTSDTTIEKSVCESASEESSINVAEKESMNSGNTSVIESENKSIKTTTNESTESADESFEILDISGKTNDDNEV